MTCKNCLLSWDVDPRELIVSNQRRSFSWKSTCIRHIIHQSDLNGNRISLQVSHPRWEDPGSVLLSFYDTSSAVQFHWALFDHGAVTPDSNICSQ
jgi:hypothetical protein